MSAEPTNWREAVRKMAWRISQEDYPTGHLAALRRLDPERPDGQAFWSLVGQDAPEAFESPHAASALASVVRGMAIAHPFHRPLDGRRRLGEALAEAEVSELRLLRLLRLPGGELPDELRRLARLMAAKGDIGRFDWSDAFGLLFRRDGEEVRHRIARDYYRTQYHVQKPEESAA
jgi:CRISPR type I-E-associated protein CasB/Cse2